MQMELARVQRYMPSDFGRLLLVACFAGMFAGCVDDAASSSNVNGADRASGSQSPIVSGTATGTASGDAGFDRLQLPTLPTIEAVESGPPPRSRDEIFAERRDVPRLYLTARTLKRVIAPTSRGIFVDVETGEICWPALGCYNPDCPDRGADQEPYGFIAANPFAYISSDGTIAYRQPTTTRKDVASFSSSDKLSEAFARDPSLLGHVCPACIEVRDLANETKADRRRYQRWVRPHELPETTERLRELNEERRRRIVWERANR